MSRSLSIVAAVLCTAALVALVRSAGPWADDEVDGLGPLEATAGRVQLVIDEQDIGFVRQGLPLEVKFTVVNTGVERLNLRQAPRDCCGDDPPPTFSVEPGQPGEIVAQLSADDLLGRGRKHIRFRTSDATCPELWVTIRGTVIHEPPGGDEDMEIE